MRNLFFPLCNYNRFNRARIEHSFCMFRMYAQIACMRVLVSWGEGSGVANSQIEDGIFVYFPT